MSMKKSYSATNMAAPQSKPRDKSHNRNRSKSKTLQGTPRSLPSSLPATPQQSTTRKYNSVDFARHAPQQHPRYNRSQSRNETPSQRNYSTRLARFDASDTGSATSSTSPTKSVKSDGGSRPDHTFQLTSPGTRSTRSIDSNGIIHKRETILGVKKTVEGMS